MIFLIFILSILALQVSILLMIRYRKTEYTVLEILWQGSYIYRDLEKYIDASKVIWVKTTAWIGVLLFLLWLISLFLIA